MSAINSMQPVQPSPLRCAQKVDTDRSSLFKGLYDSAGTSSNIVVRCPRCKSTVGNVTGEGLRQASCETCGSSLSLRQLDENGERFHRVKLLNPDAAVAHEGEEPGSGHGDDDAENDATMKRFALLEID